MQTNRTRVAPLAAAAATLMLLGSLSPQTPSLTGNWVAVQKLEDGNACEVYFQLQQNGNELTGRASYPWGIVKISDGEVEGNHFRFSQLLWEGLRLEDEGELAGNKLKYRAAGFNGKWHDYVARRAPEGEGNPPPPLPVPALQPVPSNGLAKNPPMGWNSWNKFRGKVTARLVREMANAMVASGMRDAGYIYVNIDDTWEGQRDASGVLQTNHEFPDMRALADYLHSKGLKLVLHSSPGPKTCAGYEGSYGHEELDAKTWANWGVDYLKYDWCRAGRIYETQDLQAVYQKMADALGKSGRPIVYSLCKYGMGNVWKWGQAVGANLWRTTGDIDNNWKIMSQIGFGQDKLAAYAGPGHRNDPDMLEVGNGGMDADEYRTHMSLWCILAAPLLTGNDLRAMTPEIREILVNHEVIAIDQNPLSKRGLPISKSGDQEIWAKPLKDGAVAVGLFNRGEAPATMELKLADLKTPLQGEARDLWAHREVKVEDGEFTTIVPRHGVVLLRVE